MPIRVKRHPTTDLTWEIYDGERYLGEVTYNERVKYISFFWLNEPGFRQLVFVGNKHPTLLDAVNTVLAYCGISPLDVVQVE